MFTRFAPHRRGRATAVVLGLLLLAAVIVVALVLRGGRSLDLSEIPTVDLTAAEPALARRIEERMAAVTATPRDAEAWGRLGVAYDVHGYTDEAIPCYERAISLDDGVFLWHYLMGHARRDSDPTAALAHFQRADELRNDYAPVPCLIGLLQVKANEIDAADDSFARSLGLADGMVATILGRARVALARNDSKSALYYLERAKKLEPKELENYFLFGEAFRMAGDNDEAMRNAGIAGADWKPEPLDDPVRDDLWLSEGVTMEWRRRRSDEYAAAGEVEKFVAEWEDAMREQPTSAEPHIQLGEAYGFVERYDLALASCEDAIALDPVSARARFGQGRALILLGRADEGFEALREALKIDPELRDARLTLSRWLIDAKRIDEALEVLRDGADGAPDNADAQFDLGAALRATNRHVEARAALDKALALDADHIRATFELAIIDGAAGDYQAAIVGFQKVTTTAPRIAGAHMNLGQAYLVLGQTEDAVEAFRLGAAHHPVNAPIVGALAWIYGTNPDERFRDGERGVALGKRLITISQRSSALHLDILAAACAEVGHWEPAIAYASDAVEILSKQFEESGNPALKARMMEVQTRLEGYHEKRPYRDLR